jgi:hypothetical protein
MTTRLVDTDVLIDAGRGVEEATDTIEQTATRGVAQDCQLISKNQRDFRFIDDLDLPPYPPPFE